MQIMTMNPPPSQADGRREVQLHRIYGVWRKRIARASSVEEKIRLAREYAALREHARSGARREVSGHGA